MKHDLIKTNEQFARLLARITDNGGATCDRYNFYFRDGDVLGLSGDPSSPLGFSQWSEYDPNVCADSISRVSTPDFEGPPEYTKRLSDLPPEIVEHAIGRVNEGVRDWVEQEIKANPSLYSSRGELAGDKPELDREWFLDLLEGYFAVPDEHPFVMNMEDLL